MLRVRKWFSMVWTADIKAIGNEFQTTSSIHGCNWPGQTTCQRLRETRWKLASHVIVIVINSQVPNSTLVSVCLETNHKGMIVSLILLNRRKQQRRIKPRSRTQWNLNHGSLVRNSARESGLKMTKQASYIFKKIIIIFLSVYHLLHKF